MRKRRNICKRIAGKRNDKCVVCLKVQSFQQYHGDGKTEGVKGRGMLGPPTKSWEILRR